MSTLSTADVIYPDSDGKPMAESDLHRDWMVCNIQRLQRFFVGQRVYVSGNLLIYYVEGSPQKSFAPDTFVVKDCDPRPRTVFKTWEEGAMPCTVMETTSASTRREDLVTKMRLYAQLGIPEYFLYDPLGEWLDPQLLGFSSKGEGYIPMEPDDKSCLFSDQLGITLTLENGRLAMFETATGKRLLSDAELALDVQHRIAEAEKRADDAEQRLDREAAARKLLEEELTRLRSTPNE